MSLEFGTAGIRGIVGDTKEFLNEAYAAQIFEAYAKYLNDKFQHFNTIIFFWIMACCNINST